MKSVARGRRRRRGTRNTGASGCGPAPALGKRGVGGGLELRKAGERRRVAEGEQLGGKHAGHAAGRVDPVVEVGQAGPAVAGGSAARGQGHVDLVEAGGPALLVGREAVKEVDLVGERRLRVLQGRLDVHAWREEVGQGVGGHRVRAQDLLARGGGPALVEEDLEKLHVVGHGAVEPVAARVELRVVDKRAAQRGERAVGGALVELRGGGAQARGAVEGERVGGQRGENVPAAVLAEREAGHLVHHLAHPVGVDAVVPARAGLKQQRGLELVPGAAEDVRGARVVLQLCVRMAEERVREARRVREQVA